MNGFVASTALAPAPQYPEAGAMIDAVEEMTGFGFRVFPLRPGTAEPVSDAWETEATLDDYTAKDAFKRVRDANLGLALGRLSGVFAVVAKGREGAAALEFLPDFAGALSPSWELKGPEGESVRLYGFPPHLEIRRRPSFAGLDILADGESLPLPPSWTWKGAWRWTGSRDPGGPALASEAFMRTIFGAVALRPPSDDPLRYRSPWELREAIIGAAKDFEAAVHPERTKALDRLLSRITDGAKRAQLSREAVEEVWSGLWQVLDLSDLERSLGDHIVKQWTGMDDDYSDD